ncbi:hypothetical protein GCM10020367_59380 [Streptomyces sannanensis]|uniref:Uncharacterized protein n=1 Tax=Streptomyces sannanensis TaxID=285536 RepID=A0ABP6SJT3_9ACTN
MCSHRTPRCWWRPYGKCTGGRPDGPERPPGAEPRAVSARRRVPDGPVAFREGQPAGEAASSDAMGAGTVPALILTPATVRATR